MYARVNSFEGPVERIDDGVRYIQDEIVRWGQGIEGYKGTIALVDRETGKTLGITLWESHEKMLASESAAAGMRSSAADAMGTSSPKVERYEVAVWEV